MTTRTKMRALTCVVNRSKRQKKNFVVQIKVIIFKFDSLEKKNFNPLHLYMDNFSYSRAKLEKLIFLLCYTNPYSRTSTKAPAIARNSAVFSKRCQEKIK